MIPKTQFLENFEDFTNNSSIIEFLNQEKLCLDLDNASELDVESLFEEINRLADNSDERSVDEIIKEAEMLMKNTNLDDEHAFNNNINTENEQEFPGNIHKNNGSIEKLGKTNLNSTNVIDNSMGKIECKEKGIRTQTKISSKSLIKTDKINNKNGNIKNDNKEIEVNNVLLKNSSDTNKINNNIIIHNNNNNGKIQSHGLLSSEKIGNLSMHLSRERILEKEIEVLQEKLKDTEERFNSLRIQHDSLVQQHRTIKDSGTQFQEETEKLKLEVQHLSECANILRTELQNARSDRNDAIEIQKNLQEELNESNKDKKRINEQLEKDSKMIQDLQRQCREMERILMRKQPDSLSSLMTSSKTSNQSEDNTSSRRLLEQRISQLESDAKEQDMKAQKILANVQAKFSSVQAKYETHIADLETQVLSLQEINSRLNEKLASRIDEIEKYKQKNSTSSTYSQTDDIAEKEFPNTKNVASQTDPQKSLASGINKQSMIAKKTIKLSNSLSENTINQNLKDDTHLLSTIRDMRVDLAIKDKAMQRLTRELEECKKTIKKLQKERDVYLKSDKGGVQSKKNYNPNQFSENTNEVANALKEAQNRIKLLEFDYKALHEKRLQDLKTLQAAHERELVSCHESVRILQQRLNEKDDSVTSQKRKRVPIDYYALKAKVSSLEKRHSEREQRLHMLVDALSKGRLNGDLEQMLKENREISQNGQ